MSRSIKFRAWNTKDKKMSYRAEHSYDCGAYYDVDICVSCFGEILDDDEYIVEQYTGLTDKNGKEIYEGDIVKARWYRAKNARLDTQGEVKFADGWFYIKDDPDGQDRIGVPIHNCYDIKIIGNIHEKPELAGETK